MLERRSGVRRLLCRNVIRRRSPAAVFNSRRGEY